jgi:hypothetical protein
VQPVTERTSATAEQRETACKTTGHRLRHDARVLDAIQELAKERFRLVAHRATEELVKLMDGNQTIRSS